MGIKKQVHFKHVPCESDRWHIPGNMEKTHEQIGIERATAWATKNGFIIVSYTVVVKDCQGNTEDDIPEEINFVLRPVNDVP